MTLKDHAAELIAKSADTTLGVIGGDFKQTTNNKQRKKQSEEKHCQPSPPR